MVSFSLSVVDVGNVLARLRREADYAFLCRCCILGGDDDEGNLGQNVSNILVELLELVPTTVLMLKVSYQCIFVQRTL